MTADSSFWIKDFPGSAWIKHFLGSAWIKHFLGSAVAGTTQICGLSVPTAI